MKPHPPQHTRKPSHRISMLRLLVMHKADFFAFPGQQCTVAISNSFQDDIHKYSTWYTEGNKKDKQLCFTCAPTHPL